MKENLKPCTYKLWEHITCVTAYLDVYKRQIYDFEVFDEISKSEFIDVYKLENKDEFPSVLHIVSPLF